MILQLLQALSRVDKNISSWLGEDLLRSKTLLLYILLEKGATSPSALAEVLDLSRGRMTHLLHDLEEDDLVKRSADPEDGRAFLIHLTAKGSGQAKKARAAIVGFEAEAKDELGDTGFLLLIEQLERLSGLSGRNS
jgi:DNA-binding MarR family transcriptional regulator